MLLTGAKIQPAQSPIVCDETLDLLWGCWGVRKTPQWRYFTQLRERQNICYLRDKAVRNEQLKNEQQHFSMCFCLRTMERSHHTLSVDVLERYLLLYTQCVFTDKDACLILASPCIQQTYSFSLYMLFLHTLTIYNVKQNTL